MSATRPFFINSELFICNSVGNYRWKPSVITDRITDKNIPSVISTKKYRQKYFVGDSVGIKRISGSDSFSNPTRFCQIVGALQYLTFTRSDICFVVNRVYQFMYAPTDSHWAVKRILRYLKGTTSYGFHIT